MNRLLTLLASAMSLGGVAAADASPTFNDPAKLVETKAWEEARSVGNSRAMVQFLLRHPDSVYATEARETLQQLKKESEKAPADGSNDPTVTGLFQHI